MAKNVKYKDALYVRSVLTLFSACSLDARNMSSCFLISGFIAAGTANDALVFALLDWNELFCWLLLFVVFGDIPLDHADKSITEESFELEIEELLGVTDGVDEEVATAEGGNIEPDNVPLGCSPCAVKYDRIVLVFVVAPLEPVSNCK
jgi:hypothetical protein